MIKFKIHLDKDIVLSGKQFTYTDAIDQIGRYIEDRDLSTEDIKFIEIGDKNGN